MIIPVECIDAPCIGAPVATFEWWRLVLLFIGFTGLGATLIRAVLLFNEWRSSWRRK